MSDAPLQILVTGANRGVGLGLASVLREDGHAVIGTARRTGEAADLHATGAEVLPLEVDRPDSIDALARALDGRPIDVLVNNAGISGSAKTLDDVTPDAIGEVVRVNCTGPLLVTRALLPNLEGGRRRLVVNISSQLGSIALTHKNGRAWNLGYNISKAALGMATAALVAPLRERGIAIVAVHPGWVQTDMGGREAHLTPRRSGELLRDLVNRLGPADSGYLFNTDGQLMPF